jgi:predicted secreted protein
MRKYLCLTLFFVLVLLPAGLFAGDVAQFVNLGFSADSNVFMFGQYGIRSEDTRAYAEIYAVDVPKNRFVKGGASEKVFDTEIEPGQDGIGALFELFHTMGPLAERYKIDHLATGRVVYLLVNGAEPKERLEFRDFYKGDSYVLTLMQQKFGREEGVRSSFHINLSVTDRSGNTRAYTLGLPDYRREGIMSYRIKQVLFSPDERGLVCVVEKHSWEAEGKSIRYMVETLRLN